MGSIVGGAGLYVPTAPDDGGDMFMWAEGFVPMRNGKTMAPIGPRSAPYEPMEGAPWPPQPASPERYDHATLIALNEQAGDYAAHNHATFAPAAVLAFPSIAYRLALATAGEVDVAVSLTLGLDSYNIAEGSRIVARGGWQPVWDGRRPHCASAGAVVSGLHRRPPRSGGGGAPA